MGHALQIAGDQARTQRVLTRPPSFAGDGDDHVAGPPSVAAASSSPACQTVPRVSARSLVSMSNTPAWARRSRK